MPGRHQDEAWGTMAAMHRACWSPSSCCLVIQKYSTHLPLCVIILVRPETRFEPRAYTPPCMCDVSQQRRRIASLLKWRHLESLPLASPYQRAPVHTGSSTRPSRTETPGGITLMHATLTRSPDVALERAPDTALPSPPPLPEILATARRCRQSRGSSSALWLLGHPDKVRGRETYVVRLLTRGGGRKFAGRAPPQTSRGVTHPQMCALYSVLTDSVTNISYVT